MRDKRGLAGFVLMACLLVMGGCAAKTPIQVEDDGHLDVVTTIFPYYDFVRAVGGDLVHVTMMLPAGMDSHSFEPTPAHMLALQNTDVLIYNGGVMEQWLTQVLHATDAAPMVVVSMMDYVDVLEEATVEGMEPEDHDHDGHESEIEYDEHIWTSPLNAIKIVTAIKETLQQADEGNREVYEENANRYMKELYMLHEELSDVMKHRVRNTMVLGDKFPFLYLAQEYELQYHAAFRGCSTDTEPSAKTIAYLIDKIKQEGIPVVYYLELSSPKVARIIEEETGAFPLLLHSCHNVTRQEFEQGVTYLQLMQQNVSNLRKGLVE